MVHASGQLDVAEGLSPVLGGVAWAAGARQGGVRQLVGAQRLGTDTRLQSAMVDKAKLCESKLLPSYTEPSEPPCLCRHLHLRESISLGLTAEVGVGRQKLHLILLHHLA